MPTALSQFLSVGAALGMAGAASGAVVMAWTAVPAHLAGSPGGAYGPGSRVLDVDADGQPDLLIYESTVCTDDNPSSSCRSTVSIRGLNGTSVARTVPDLIQPGAMIGAVISNPAGAAFGTYSKLNNSAISHLNRRLLPPVSATPRNPFGEGVLDGLVAFQLPDDAGASHFGYVHLDYRSWPERDDTSLFQASSPIVQGWAYETDADTPIEAWLIPEPGSMLLGSVLSVCLGLRRRRTFGGSATSR